MQVSATETFEFECDIQGVYERGMRATHNDPGHAASIEDVEVTGLSYNGKSLFDGVDMTNPEIRKLLGNIVDAMGYAAESPLWDQVERGL